MDLKSVGKGILGAFMVLGAIVGGIGLIYLALFIYTIILGAVYEIAQSGDLPITTGANTTLATLETGANTAMVAVNSGTTFATSLIPIAVILLVFGGIAVVGYQQYKKRRGSSGNGGNLGY